MKYPALMSSWFRDSNFLVVVSVPDEDALGDLAIRACGIGPFTVVEEPDLGGERTALALGPGEAASRLCANLPLALKERVPI